jgi:hypothetical protein
MNGHVIIQTEDDAKWWSDGERNEWALPPAATSFCRARPMRYVRALTNLSAVERHERFFRSIGMIPTGYDRWVLYAIWRGWC